MLITGATCFIGRHLVARLRQGGHVVWVLAYDPGGPTICPEGVESVIEDVCDAQGMKTVTAGCDAVFHLAGKAMLSRK
jgi:nucleoside-diphosphate-sugar epimerase